jgi:hypothetical protein
LDFQPAFDLWRRLVLGYVESGGESPEPGGEPSGESPERGGRPGGKPGDGLD